MLWYLATFLPLPDACALHRTSKQSWKTLQPQIATVAPAYCQDIARKMEFWIRANSPGMVREELQEVPPPWRIATLRMLPFSPDAIGEVIQRRDGGDGDGDGDGATEVTFLKMLDRYKQEPAYPAPSTEDLRRLKPSCRTPVLTAALENGQLHAVAWKAADLVAIVELIPQEERLGILQAMLDRAGNTETVPSISADQKLQMMLCVWSLCGMPPERTDGVAAAMSPVRGSDWMDTKSRERLLFALVPALRRLQRWLFVESRRVCLDRLLHQVACALIEMGQRGIPSLIELGRCDMPPFGRTGGTKQMILDRTRHLLTSADKLALLLSFSESAPEGDEEATDAYVGWLLKEAETLQPAARQALLVVQALNQIPLPRPSALSTGHSRSMETVANAISRLAPAERLVLYASLMNAPESHAMDLNGGHRIAQFIYDDLLQMRPGCFPLRVALLSRFMASLPAPGMRYQRYWQMDGVLSDSEEACFSETMAALNHEEVLSSVAALEIVKHIPDRTRGIAHWRKLLDKVAPSEWGFCAIEAWIPQLEALPPGDRATILTDLVARSSAFLPEQRQTVRSHLFRHDPVALPESSAVTVMEGILVDLASSHIDDEQAGQLLDRLTSWLETLPANRRHIATIGRRLRECGHPNCHPSLQRVIRNDERNANAVVEAQSPPEG